jgi:hypothetical protein
MTAKGNGKQNTGQQANDYGVVSGAVGHERAEKIRRSAKALKRSVSWVVSEMLTLGEKKYFETYPLPEGRNGPRPRRASMTPAAPAS